MSDFEDAIGRALGYADIADLPEDDRLTIIGTAAAGGRLIGFVVDDDAKADRYIAKLTQRFKVRIIQRAAGPHGMILVQVGPAES